MLNVGLAGLATREVVEAMDVEWGLQHVREIQLTLGDMIESLLDVRGLSLFDVSSTYP